MAQLNQIIAVEKNIKNKTHATLTALHHGSQKLPLLSGIARSYQPRDDAGDTLPPESTRVQVRLEDILREVAETMTRLFDVTLDKDATNCIAKADVGVSVDGVEETLLEDVPVTYLLFLEKKLVDLHTIVRKLPTLDPADEWHFDENTNSYATPPAKTTRTKKVPRNHVVAEATEKHPAQVTVYHEDVIVGDWTTIKYSGALPAKRVADILTRIEALQVAVKFAREKANSTDVERHEAGKKIFDFVFAT